MNPHRISDNEWKKLNLLPSFGYVGNQGFPVRNELLRIPLGRFSDRIILEVWRTYNQREPNFQIPS